MRCRTTGSERTATVTVPALAWLYPLFVNIVSDWLRKQISDPQIVSLALLLALIWAAMTFIPSVFAPLLAALLVAYLLEGPVTRLERFGMRRLWAALLTWLVFVTLAAVVLWTLVPLMIKQSVQVLRELPSVATQLREWYVSVANDYPNIFSVRQMDEVAGSLSIDLDQMQRGIVTRSHLLGAGLTLIVVYLILVPILVLFMLKDKHQMLGWARHFLPRDISLIARVWYDMDGQIANYVRGKVVEILIVWAASFLIYRVLGLNYAVLLGAVTGFSVLVPWVGATLVTIPVAAVAFAQFGLDSQFAGVMLAYGVLQALDGNVLVPLIFSETNDLHPAAIIVAVMFFGGVWGFWGVFFAIPLATLVHAVIKAWPRAPEVLTTPAATTGQNSPGDEGAEPAHNPYRLDTPSTSPTPGETR